MKKNKKRNIERNDVPVSSPLSTKPSYANFVMHCYNNDECGKVLLEYAPKIGATNCMTYDEFIYLVGGYGSMKEVDYNHYKAQFQEKGMNEFEQLFFNLMDELREILKPLYKNALEVVYECSGFVMLADYDGNKD